VPDPRPAAKRGRRGASVAERLAVVPAAEIRRVMVRYVEVRGAVLRPATITSLVEGLALSPAVW
jgi:hypothetical protein